MKLKFTIIAFTLQFAVFAQTYEPYINSYINFTSSSVPPNYKLGGVFVSSNEKIYVVNRIDHRIEILTQSGTNIGTFATFGSVGTLTGEFSHPFGICEAPDNKIYVTEFGNKRVQVLTQTGNAIGYFANFPSTALGGVFVSQNGYIYLSGQSCIEVWTQSGSNYSKIAQLGTNNVGSSNNEFNSPYGVCVGNNGYIYIPDYANRRVQVWTQSGTNFGYLATMGTTTVSGLSNDKFFGPISVSVSQQGYIYIADILNNRIQVWTNSGTNFGYFATLGTANAGNANNEFNNPICVFAHTNGYIYISERNNGRLSVWKNVSSTTSGNNTVTGVSVSNLDSGKQTINISPNPTDGTINLLNSKTIRVIVYNIMGVAVFEKVILPNSQLDISHLPSGLYLLKDNESGFVGKVYKQ